jgi:hypothetical protein
MFSESPYPRIYEWTGGDWVLVSDEPGPGQWYWFGLAYDSSRRSVIFTGGYYDEQYNDETWEWGEAGWTQLAVEPELARSSHATVYDTVRRRLVLFGGCDATGRFGDTWEADTDTFLSITDHPSPREAIPGETVGFRVRVVASGPVTYQWRKDGEPLEDNERIDGSHTELLRIEGVKSFDVAAYDVVVMRECGSRISRTANLTLKTLPAMEMSGTCPGSIQIRLTHAYPNANVALFFGDNYGPLHLWLEPCGPTTLGVRPPRLRAVGMYRSGPDGTLTIDGRIGRGFCGGYLQMMDFSQCLTSNVLAIR